MSAGIHSMPTPNTIEPKPMSLYWGWEPVLAQVDCQEGLQASFDIALPLHFGRTGIVDCESIGFRQQYACCP